jgi:GT2 family glycosyltransferase
MKTAETLSVKQGAALKKKAKKLVTIAIIAGADSEPEALQATLASIAAQTYTRFEILVAGEGPPQTATKYRWIGHTPDIWQAIARESRGDVVTVLDAGDNLLPWALAYIGAAFETAEKPEFVYADEDSLLSGKRTRPRFKPGWSPYFLAQSNYIGKPWGVARSVLAGAAADILPEHDLLKAIAGKAKAVAHIPKVLCSRPLRSIVPEDASALPVVRAGGPRVSLIIPTCLRHLDIIERCFQGLTGLTAYNDIEVILVTNNLSDPAEAEAFLKRWPFKVVHWEGEGFNWSALNNFGTRHATGDYLLYFNDDVESIKADWLDRLVLTLEDSGAGIIGPMLRYPNRTMQHLGINLVPYGGGARHLFRFCSGLEDNLRWIMNHPREVSAVTGACLLTTRALFDALDGFDETIPVVCNDVDFCLRAQAKGYKVLIDPRSELIHHEGISRTGISETEDVKRFWGRWGTLLKSPDPYTNPNLDTMRDDWMVAPTIARLPIYRASDVT